MPYKNQKDKLENAARYRKINATEIKAYRLTKHGKLMRSAAQRRYRERHPERCKAAVKASQQKRVAWYKKYKSTTPCADCGRIFPPECMDFDHIGQKTTCVALIAGSKPRDFVEKEIAQC